MSDLFDPIQQAREAGAAVIDDPIFNLHTTECPEPSSKKQHPIDESSQKQLVVI